MKHFDFVLLSLLMTAVLLMTSQPAGAVPVESGVSRALAEYRAANISDVSYELSFTIPEEKDEPVSFFETLTFRWLGDENLQIDFQGASSQLDGIIMVNGKAVDTRLENEHIIIPSRYLRLGENKVMIGGCSGDKALNRHDNFLYTLFVPDNARSVFPCFDQPDLKALFELELELPAGWVSISNETEKPIPTYLFSFTAGRFRMQTATRDGRELTALYRDTDPEKVAQLPAVFDQVALALRWMERYTGLVYPFEKYGFVVLPGYQFGGMEHPGCIQFNDHKIFLGSNPSTDELMSRFNLIAHETAHMWFGDLVTMRWFDDVWTKEVFANFMADKMSREQFHDVNHDLAFIKAHYPAAMGTDRTRGTHPIQQPLDNLAQAGLLYGNIIYHKAPIMMSKLEQEIGSDALQKGLRSYLRRYAYGNATWDELIAELDRFAPQHSARSFSDVWVKHKGMPVISCSQASDDLAEIVQQDPYGRGLIWKQRLDVALVGEHGVSQPVQVYMDEQRVPIEMTGSGTAVVNCGGMGYGRFVMSSRAISDLCSNWDQLGDEKHRYAAVLNLYENCLMGNVAAGSLLENFIDFLERENNELVASTLCSEISTLCQRCDGTGREAAEQRLLQIAGTHELQSVRQALLRQLGVMAVSPGVLERLYGIWSRQESGLLNNRDYTSMCYHLAIMMPDRWQQILSTQRERLTSVDEQNGFDFISRACNPDPQAQQQLFDELLQARNRRVEPWARTMLALLNDPSREPLSNRYLVPGLDALEEVHRTGDIFFTGYWLDGLLSGHRSDEARDIVSSWIASHQSLSPALMNKLLEHAYWLLDACK